VPHLQRLIALRQHAELLRMLTNPRLRIDDTQDPLDESDEAFKDLDDSKKKALREILSTLPLFLLQGLQASGRPIWSATLSAAVSTTNQRRASCSRHKATRRSTI